MTFDELLMTQNIPEWAITSREIMRKAWDAATTAERERCEKECEGLSNDDEPPYKDYEDTYLNGWLDACNECKWVIHGYVKGSIVKTSEVFTALEIPEAAKVEMDFFSNNSRIDNNSYEG